MDSKSFSPVVLSDATNITNNTEPHDEKYLPSEKSTANLNRLLAPTKSSALRCTSKPGEQKSAGIKGAGTCKPVSSHLYQPKSLHSTFKSSQEHINDFFSRTPTRYHTLSRNSKFCNDETKDSSKHTGGLPPRKPAFCTKPEPFRLRIDERGEKQQEAFRKRVAEEDKLAKERALHHANPASVLYKAPFQPKKSSQPATEPLDFVLNSERRAEERQQQLEATAALEAEREALLAEREKIREEMEKEELRKAREATVVHPEPITKYRPLVIQRSCKPLTNPRSPSFSHNRFTASKKSSTSNLSSHSASNTSSNDTSFNH